MASIEFRGLCKRYADGTEAVRGLDLTIEDGEVMVIVGPSGCGKSTVLRMTAGLEDISDGELLIDGESVKGLPPSARDLAMVFQSYALYPHMSVRQNMGFALKIAKVPKAEIERRVEEAARMLDLTRQLDRKPAKLSGGQRQRVAMGRAIVRQPEAFLMDEPLSNLDAKLRVQMRTSVAQLQRQLGTTTLYVTHDQTEAMTLGDRLAVMRSGVLQQVETPERLYEEPANVFVAGFLGSPAINLVPGRVTGETIELPFAIVPLPRALGLNGSGREIVVGIRPEHFEDALLANGAGEHRVRVSAPVEVVESLGSERFVYFPARARPEQQAKLRELLDRDAATAEEDTLAALKGNLQIAARVSASSGARAGRQLDLALDTSRLLFFDAESGKALPPARP